MSLLPDEPEISMNSFEIDHVPCQNRSSQKSEYPNPNIPTPILLPLGIAKKNHSGKNGIKENTGLMKRRHEADANTPHDGQYRLSTSTKAPQKISSHDQRHNRFWTNLMTDQQEVPAKS